MSKQDIAVCGLRYGKTKVQAELIKKYIEENSLTEIKITILDSESKQKLDKIKEYIENNSLYEEEYDYDYDENIQHTGTNDEIAKRDILSIIGEQQ
jgi:hypothetical protein